MQELNSTELLSVFVERGVESTLERSTIAREHMGQLLHQLVKAGILPTAQYYKGSVSRAPLRSITARSGFRWDVTKHSLNETMVNHPFVIRLHQILEMAEDIAIDIPHIWLYLADLITPMLHEGGIQMGELFR